MTRHNVMTYVNGKDILVSISEHFNLRVDIINRDL